VLLVAVLVAWPWLRARFQKQPPTDPVERAAATYLDALVRQDEAMTSRVGIIEDPPAIRSYDNLRSVSDSRQVVRGRFAPLAALNERIEKEYTYDPAIGRFTPRNPLGPAAETLDALHAARENAEKSGLYRKMESGDPDEIFEAAEGLGQVFTNLAEGVLAPKKILPTYAMLVEESKPPLPDAEKTLAIDFAEHPDRWDRLLKRPFLSLKADGPFLFDHAEVTAQVADRLASLGDPPSTLRLQLVRFRLEGIDTGWKVVSARREQAGTDPARAPADHERTSSSSQPSPTPTPTSEPRSLGNPGPDTSESPPSPGNR
jgi:hypothetical protein